MGCNLIAKGIVETTAGEESDTNAFTRGAGEAIGDDVLDVISEPPDQGDGPDTVAAATWSGCNLQKRDVNKRTQKKKLVHMWRKVAELLLTTSEAQ